MQFHLTYEGLLLGSSRDNTRPDHKHEIRRVFHRQLRRLWEGHPWLNQVKHGVYVGFEHIPPIPLFVRVWRSDSHAVTIDMSR